MSAVRDRIKSILSLAYLNDADPSAVAEDIFDALREPDEDMKQAGAIMLGREGSWDAAEAVWQAMLDAREGSLPKAKTPKSGLVSEANRARFRRNAPMTTEKLSCQRCGKRLSRKTARLIEGQVTCSSCLFAPMRK